MLSFATEVGIVESIILLGAALAFLVHPVVMLFASLRAIALGTAREPKVATSYAARVAGAPA
ncbi:MAG: hypothetical protein FWE87_03045 [Coriobacteriia bacterium]|nr:hypothetical protein [Coriobacteriia bacterium]